VSVAEIFLIAIALSMDAFAVALCKGFGMQKIRYSQCFIIAVFFGGFQFIMPLIGWLLTSHFQKYISSVDHWIVFFILSLIGAKMMYESFQPSNCAQEGENFSVREIFFLAIATSIDALAVGATFAMFPEKSILFSAILIGVVTFLLSFLGTILGSKCGTRYAKKAEFAGGFILVCLGIKILFEHLSVA